MNSGEAAAFMWERFTTKKYYDLQEIRQIGEIYTPWPSWLITASSTLKESQIAPLLSAINEGIAYYQDHHEEAMEYIYTNLDYTRVDAEAWSKTVTYPEDVRLVDETMVSDTITTLRKAGLMRENPEIMAKDMIQTI